MSVFAGVGERTREGNDLITEMTESGVIESTALVFGQMDEPPGTRLRVALSALTMAEYFRDEKNQDVLLFIDNIFRFTQAGSEVSTLLGRMPSAVGYQPTLADEMGELQERITSTRGRSITSLQAIYVPADDITDPAPHTTFAHLDATTVLSRPISEKGIYPAVDPLDSTSRILDPQYVGPGALRHRPDGEADPAALPGAPGHHRHPRHRRARRGGQGHGQPGPAHRALPLAEHVRGRGVHRSAGLVRAAVGDAGGVQGADRGRPTTTSPSRPSSCRAGSRTSRRTRRSSRRADRPHVDRTAGLPRGPGRRRPVTRSAHDRAQTERHPIGWMPARVLLGRCRRCRPSRRCARAAGTVTRNDVDLNATQSSPSEVDDWRRLDAGRPTRRCRAGRGARFGTRRVGAGLHASAIPGSASAAGRCSTAAPPERAAPHRREPRRHAARVGTTGVDRAATVRAPSVDPEECRGDPAGRVGGRRAEDLVRRGDDGHRPHDRGRAGRPARPRAAARPAAPRAAS